MRHFILFFFLWSLFATGLTAQNIRDIYRKPLKESIDEVARQFNISVRYGKEIDNKEVEFASWRINNEAESSLNNLLSPFGLFAVKQSEIFVVKTFSYHQRPIIEGKVHLDTLYARFGSRSAWESRRKDLKNNILTQCGLVPMPKKTPLNPQVTEKRVYKDYSVENVIIEVIPGVFLCGNLYKPTKIKGVIPAILSPHGHFTGGDLARHDFSEWGRFRPDQQRRCAELARLGCVVFSYNMFAQGEMIFQIPLSEHYTPFALTMQTLSGIRAIDFISTLKEVDIKRIGITGASGGGTQAFLLAAIDDRIALSVPAVMVSAHFFGGCACESGLPIHFPKGGIRTCNPEIAAITAPRPQLLISDGNDWTANNPAIEFPYLQKIYTLYGKETNVELVHLPNDQHDYGLSKRIPMYCFVAKHFNLDIRRISQSNGSIDESMIVIEPYTTMLAIKNPGKLPANALRDVEMMKKRIRVLQ